MRNPRTGKLHLICLVVRHRHRIGKSRPSRLPQMLDTQMLVPDTGMLPDRNGRYHLVEIGGGNKYTGDWRRGSMHGKGEYEFADGRR